MLSIPFDKRLRHTMGRMHQLGIQHRLAAQSPARVPMLGITAQADQTALLVNLSQNPAGIRAIQRTCSALQGVHSMADGRRSVSARKSRSKPSAVTVKTP
jgi:hypothetical protein